jgi:hypothetical protein
MKRKLCLLLPLLVVFFHTYSQPGWREHEMEVRIDIANENDASSLYQLHLNGDVYPSGYALMYVTPEELAQIEDAGLNYEILKADLNEYYKGFWENRDAYHTYEEIIQVMNTLLFAYPDICDKYDFGLSVEGRQLTALKISDNVETDEDEPEVMFDGGIHGDEIGGPENLIRFAQMLCESYATDPDIAELINTREIWLYVMVNPDGRVNMVRYNSNGVDLNRDWGYMWNAEGGSPAPFSQVESRSLRDCLYDNQFVVHTTYHSGTEFLSYPWSYRPEATADQDHIDYLASLYASTSGYSTLPYAQGYSGMYPINGSSKDYYYAVAGSIGWTMEISYNKQPPTSQIQYYYELNEPAMLMTIEHSGYGLQGTVTDAVTGEPLAAMVWINDFYPAFCDPQVGDFHKYVLAGSYTVTVTANGYLPQAQANVTVSSEGATTVNFQLQPGGGYYAWRIPNCMIPDNNFDDEGYTPGALGAPDNIRYSIGRAGWVVLDMQEPILDGPGSELTVYENDSDPEGYVCYAAATMDGPWIFLGNGTGNTTFNFTQAGLSEARYIKIVDDGNGSASGNNAGFDLDAIEALEQPDVVYLFLDCMVDDAQGNDNQRIDPGETVELIIALTNHGGLAASDVTGNLNYDSTWVAIDNPDLAFGTIGHGETVQRSVTLTADPATPLETIVMMVLNLTANSGGFVQSFPMHFTIGEIVEDWETNTFNSFPWASSGSKPWTISFVGPYEGAYSAKSGNIDNSQLSVLQVSMDVIGYDDISFYRKVSTEAGYDFLNFYIDGVLLDQWSGTMDWLKVSYDVAPGMHTFKWEYKKDEANGFNFDCCWIDYIVFPSSNLNGSLHALANAFPHEYCHPGETQLGAYVIGGTTPYAYLWTPEDSLSSPNAQFPSANPSETTLYNVTVTDQSAASVQSAIKVTVHAIPGTPVAVQQGDSLVSSSESGNQWYNTDGLIEGATAQVYYPSAEGDYFVIVTNEFGCISEPSETVHFLFTDIIENERKSFNIYPVPAGEHVYISLVEGFTGTTLLEIIDLMGKVVYSTSCDGSDGHMIKIDLYHLPSGIYFISLTSLDSGDRRVKKFIRQAGN